MADGLFSFGTNVWPGVSKLNEECGEVVQVIGKLMGTQGDELHWDGSNLRIRLQEEIADVQAAILFVQQVNPRLDVAAIDRRTEEKVQLFWEWHRRGSA